MTRIGRSPSETVASAYRAANRGRYSQANSYLTTGFRNQLRAITVDMRAAKKACRDPPEHTEYQGTGEACKAAPHASAVRGSALSMEGQHSGQVDLVDRRR